MTSSLDLAARISIALCVWGTAPIATAETVKEGPGADWDRPRTLEEKMRTSFEEAVLVVRGTVLPAGGADLRPLDHRGFASMRVRFEVDEIYKGETAQETLRLDLPTYEIPESEPSREGDGSPMGESWSRLRALERELEAGGIDWDDYERRRSALRQDLLTSPEYREGGHLLARIGIRGAIPPSHRNTDQLLQMGESYLLMMDTEPWEEKFTPLRADLVDIYPVTQMHVLRPILRFGAGTPRRKRASTESRTPVLVAGRQPAAPGASFGPETDFLLTPVGELELGMSREALMELRGETLVHDALEPGEVPSLLFEEIGSEDGRRRIIYFIVEEKLHQLIHMDTYPLEVLDERIDRKLRAATGNWGRPDSKFAERQLPVGEYLVVVWRTGPETVLTISYVPAAARTEGATDEFPVITRYLPGSPADVGIPSIEPESFDLPAESAALDARIGSWEEDQ